MPSGDEEYLRELSELIAIASQEIKARDPNAIVTTNAGGWPYTDARHREHIRFFDGLHQDLDAITVDMYPERNNAILTAMADRVEEMKARYGKPVFIAELGICSGEGTYHEYDQSLYIPQYIEELKKADPEAIIIYELRNYTYRGRNTCEVCLGIRMGDWSKKTSYDELFRQIGGDTTLGFNVHLYPEENPSQVVRNLKKYIDLDIVEQGLGWLRIDIAPNEALSLKGAEITWDEDYLRRFGEIISYARGKGLKIFVPTAPLWHQWLNGEQYRQVVREYYSFLADRYAGQIDVWQIFNEANVHCWWDYSPRNVDIDDSP